MRFYKKNMLLAAGLLVLTLGLNGCGSRKETEEKKTSGGFETAELDADGNVVIDESSISENATYINYDADGTTVQLLAVKASDGTVRVVFNTCQVCNPSPYAYFVQDGNYFICQNCGNAFAADTVGIVRGGCNPTPVDGLSDESGKITIARATVEDHKTNFENWQGPTK